MSILRNTIVYGYIKIYRSNIKTLHFLKKLCSASTMLFCSATREPSNRSFPFCHCCTLNIDIPKSGMCRVFAQWVTYLDNFHTASNKHCGWGYKPVCVSLARCCCAWSASERNILESSANFTNLETDLLANNFLYHITSHHTVQKFCMVGSYTKNLTKP